MTVELECLECGSEEVWPLHASYSTFMCQQCGAIFDESEWESKESMSAGEEWEDEDA